MSGACVGGVDRGKETLLSEIAEEAVNQAHTPEMA